jgi:putative transposase
MIEEIHQATGYGIRTICQALEVPRSSFYHAAAPSVTELSDQIIGDEITRIFHSHQRRYGYRRIACDLVAAGVVCAPSRVRRLMAQRGLRALQPRNFVPRTSDGRADHPSPNHLLRVGVPSKPDQVWAGDITFIPTADGWLYLAVVIDLCSRAIVGWKLSTHIDATLVGEAFSNACKARQPEPGLIFHSDRGSQYGSRHFRARLAEARAVQSMSAPANPYHNAWTESFMGTLKREMLQRGSFANEGDARTEIFAYIDGYYNTQRRHSSLQYKTPAQFDADIFTLN